MSPHPQQHSEDIFDLLTREFGKAQPEVDDSAGSLAEFIVFARKYLTDNTAYLSPAGATTLGPSIFLRDGRHFILYRQETPGILHDQSSITVVGSGIRPNTDMVGLPVLGGR